MEKTRFYDFLNFNNDQYICSMQGRASDRELSTSDEEIFLPESRTSDDIRPYGIVSMHEHPGEPARKIVYVKILKMAFV